MSFLNVLQDNFFKKNISVIFNFIFFLILILFVGSRNDVGGDWSSYYNFFHSFETKNFSFRELDWLFFLSNYVFYNAGLSIFYLNVFTALISIILISRFAKDFYNPKMAILLSIPYIIFVVLMGYNRQGIALCILMFSLNYCRDRKTFKFILLILVASMFHFTSIVYLSLLIVLMKKKLLFILNLLIFIIFINIFFYFFQSNIYFSWIEFFYSKWYWYVTNNYFQSTGVYYRLAINLLPGLIFLFFYNNFKSNDVEKKIYLLFSISTLLVLPLASLGSTFVDRLLIYTYPLQLYVYSNYDNYISKKGYMIFLFLIFIFYFFILYVYFTYGLYSDRWLPYKTVLWK